MCTVCDLKTNIKKGVDSFSEKMDGAVPHHITDGIKHFLTIGNPLSLQRITGYNGYSFEEMDAGIHAILLGPTASLLQACISEKTDHIFVHMCGCGCCITAGKVDFAPSDVLLEEIRKDFISHYAAERSKFELAPVWKMKAA